MLMFSHKTDFIVYNKVMAKLKTARNKKRAKSETKKSVKKSTKKNGMSLYSNLAYKRRVKEDMRARKKAEELAKLPKNPILRFFARLRPDRVFKAIFSKEGLIRILKFCAACILLMIIAVGGLFLYFKKDLAAIDPEELASRVQNTVNTYYDRNGELLWEDRGSGDYRLVVDGSEISTYMRQATVAIEDKNFYNHSGIDLGGIARAAYVTLLKRGDVQGGSTLTQQLIKQVYFSDEAKDRSFSGIPRKIKEMILAIEVEKMYSKEQIITLYLNESPYGGRRNGVESAAQTYFKKSAKDLDLAESALLAAIPNNPGVLNPYNTDGNEALINRQHLVLNAMVDMGYITKEQSKKAKEVKILDKIQPEQNQYAGMKAPWFVLEVRNQLEKKFGIKTMREGGFSIKTTLDYRAQKIGESAVKAGQKIFYVNGADNASLVSVDVETGQIISMVGSVDWNKPGYGQVNATTSLLEPASSIKPILDYTPLFMKRAGVNYAPGSILRDENINSIYCAGTVGNCSVKNYDGRFYGNITIRRSLAGSLNIAAIKALYINGIENSLKVAHDLGDKSYCANGETAGLSMAIGGGCSVKPIEHANAYATLGRGGVYKDLVYWLEVKNSTGDVIDAWEDTKGTRAVDEQVAYMTMSILTDCDSRNFTFGYYLAHNAGFCSNSGDVVFGAKTGTSENGNGRAKDTWILTVSPVLATAIWSGNHDGRPLSNDTHDIVFAISSAYISPVHNQVYAKDGKWKKGQQFDVPSGIKHTTINGVYDYWPSWYTQKSSGISSTKKTFDRISKKLATSCTPEETKVSANVTKVIDPMTKKETYNSGEYNPNAKDDVHSCDDKRPSASVSVSSTGDEGEDESWTISATAEFGTFELDSYTLVVNGQTVKSGGLGASSGTAEYITSTKPTSISFKVVDKAGYTTTATGAAD